MLLDIMLLKPYFRETIWGGHTLAKHYNKPLPLEQNIGESWEVSAYKDMESVVANGPYQGQTLLKLVQTLKADLLGQAVVERYGTEFPLLIKLLDAREDLSIQVHPDDTYARTENLGTYGKMEAWYVLQSDNGRVAYGLQDSIDKESFASAIAENRVNDAIRFFNVKAGDVVYVPPGTVHALCQNVLVYEVQQSSDLTFRIYDYNRPDANGQPRELHIDRSLDVITFDTPTPHPKHWTDLPNATPAHTQLVQSEHFLLERFAPTSTTTHAYASFATLTLIQGQASVQGKTESITAQKGDTLFIPANCPITVSPQNNAEYLMASVP
jgi:mannose-6-phosphate isomerase